MECHEIPWSFLGGPRNSMEYRRVPLNAMGFPEVPMEFHGMPCSLYEKIHNKEIQ